MPGGWKNTLNPSCNYKHLPYSKYSKKLIIHDTKEIYQILRDLNFKENNNLISCSTNCSAPHSFIHLSTRMFSANMQEVTMEKWFLYVFLQHEKTKTKPKKNLCEYTSKGKYEMMYQTHRKIVDLSENTSFQREKSWKNESRTSPY